MYFFQFSLLSIFYVQCIAFELTFMWFLPIGTFSLFIFALTVRHVGYSGPRWCCFFILDLFRLLIHLHILLCMLNFEHPIRFVSMSGNICWRETEGLSLVSQTEEVSQLAGRLLPECLYRSSFKVAFTSLMFLSGAQSF